VSAGPASTGATAGTGRVLRVEAVFHDVDPQQADTIAAELVARAQELANGPDFGCDLDLSVETIPRGADGAAAPATR
jgi:hypothetical protein